MSVLVRVDFTMPESYLSRETRWMGSVFGEWQRQGSVEAEAKVFDGKISVNAVRLTDLASDDGLASTPHYVGPSSNLRTLFLME